MTDRNIYEYTCGVERVFADPIDVLRSLVAFCVGPPEPAAHLGELIRKSQGADTRIAGPSQAKLLAATRQVFCLPAFEPRTGNGTPDEEAHALLTDFFGWLSKKKIRLDHWPMFRPHMDIAEPATTTASSSVSGSTSSEPISNAQP